MLNRGFTLLEIMFTMTILTVVMGTIFGIAISFGDTIRVQQGKAAASDEGRRAMMRIAPELRNADRDSVNWDELPGDTLRYRVPEDLDGNGVVVDVGHNVELGPVRIIQRDVDDLNGDGITTTQLILSDGTTQMVLANDLTAVSEQRAEDGGFTSAQDTNGNGRQDVGLWFQPWDNGVMVTVQTEGRTRQGHMIPMVFQEVVYPRN